MSNWCDCELTVVGDHVRLKEFMEKMKGKDRHGEETLLNEEALIPYPEEFRRLDVASSEYRKETEQIVAKAANEEEQKKIRKERGWGPQDGYNQGGYDWCVKNWGTKWGFCNVELVVDDDGCLEYRFDTAWSPPVPLIAKMGELFKDLRFELRYYEGGCDFQDVIEVKDGEVVQDWTGDYIGHRGG
jgi:hypothetical protein